METSAGSALEHRRMDRAVGVLRSLRWSLASLSFVFAVFGGVLLLAGAPGDRFPGAAVHLVAALLAAAGARDVFARPRTWSLFGAIAVAGLIAWETVQVARLGSFPRELAPRFAALLVALAGFGFGAVQAFRMRDLHRDRGEALAAALESAGRRAPAARALGFLRRHARLLAAAAAAALAAAVLLPILLAPPPFEPSLDAFRDSWDTGDWIAVGAMLDPGPAPRMRRDLGILLARRGWRDAPPPLGPITRTAARGSRACAWFALAGGELRTDWQYRADRWVLTGVRLPDR